MLGNISLDMFVMRKKKSSYVIALLMFGAAVVFSLIEKVTMSNGSEDTDGTFISVFSSNVSTCCLFFGIFFVMFACTDLKNGYIKNIAGSVSSRMGYILSKETALAVYILLALALNALGAVVGSTLFLNGIGDLDASDFLVYTAELYVLLLGFMSLIVFFVFLMRNSTGPMIIAVLLGTNLFGNTFYRLIAMLLAKADIEFKSNYISVSGQLASVRPGADGKDILVTIAVGAAYIVIFNLLTWIAMEKKDIA